MPVCIPLINLLIVAYIRFEQHPYVRRICIVYDYDLTISDICTYPHNYNILYYIPGTSKTQK